METLSHFSFQKTIDIHSIKKAAQQNAERLFYILIFRNLQTYLFLISTLRFKARLGSSLLAATGLASP